MLRIDLNADLGESFGAWRMGEDAELLQQLSSCNIACGFHAGDPQTMLATVRAAGQAGVAVGAHPSLPDLRGFGRREMAISAAELHADLLYQLGALSAMLRVESLPLHHVKPHGALYHMLARDPVLAAAFVEAVRSFDPSLKVYGPPTGALADACACHGLRHVGEGFVDRAYGADGKLLPRSQAAAVLRGEAALAQGLRLARGEPPPGDRVAVGTLCLHGDHPGALQLAQAMRQVLLDAGVEIAAP